MKEIWRFLKENPIMMYFVVGAAVSAILVLPLLALYQ